MPVHEFWEDDVSFLDTTRIDTTRVHGPRQLTDMYLLALAVRYRGRFVTFDQAISVSAVVDSSAKNLLGL
jgi:uncharacterized protein